MASAEQTSIESVRRRYFHGLIRYFASTADKRELQSTIWVNQYCRALYAAEGLQWQREEITLEPLMRHFWLLEKKDGYDSELQAILKVLLAEARPPLFEQKEDVDWRSDTWYWFNNPQVQAPSLVVRMKGYLSERRRDYSKGFGMPIAYLEDDGPRVSVWLECEGMKSEIRKFRQLLDKELKWRQEQVDAILAKKKEQTS